MKTQIIKLNLIPGAMPGGLRPAINVSQYDVGRPLKFQLYDGKTKAEIEDDTVITVQGTKPDKTGFAYACTWSGNEVTVATQKQMTVCAGKVDCELHLVKGETEIGTANFILEVEPSALSEDTIISASDIPAIIEAARNNQLTDEAIQNAINSATAAAESESNASASERAAYGSEQSATMSAENALQSANSSSNFALSSAESASTAMSAKENAEAYAVGKRNGVDVSSTDPTYRNNSKHYSEIAQAAAVGGLIPQGTTTFALLPSLGDSRVGALWNISDAFTTTTDFREGEGIKYGAGANVYKTVDGFWDVLSGQGVTGIRGAADNTLKHGDVVLSYANMGTNGIETGGTNATTAAKARQNFFGEDLSTAIEYVLGITASWAKGGYLTLQQLRNKLGLGNTLGALPVANGGTGANSAANARSNLGVTPVSLWTGSVGDSTQVFNKSITLSQSYKNFRTLRFYVKVNYSDRGIESRRYVRDISAQQINEIRNLNNDNYTVGIRWGWEMQTEYVDVMKSSTDTVLQLRGAYSVVYKVEGLQI